LEPRLVVFLLWKQLRDDYSEEDILTFTIDLFLAGIIGARLLFVLENISYFGINFIHFKNSRELKIKLKKYGVQIK